MPPLASPLWSLQMNFDEALRFPGFLLQNKHFMFENAGFAAVLWFDAVDVDEEMAWAA
ncbi:hypothetical protein KDI_34920 [Dictyobacter arantiisoli]|uniref:Uncharacterized protein n=1 Tax=Dictyobacter arantiisoli TaxID=2014874 RepID=A0A5A5TFB6_9CHLR|nr:hypothetical protein KDI_34920 [Dictyobacter arantiisoli]